MKPSKTERVDFMVEGQPISALLEKLAPEKKNLAAAAVAAAAGASTADLSAAAAAFSAGALERPSLGKARVIYHLVRGELAPAALELIRLGVHGGGSKANRTFPDRLSAEFGLRKAIMTALYPAAPEPLKSSPAPAPAADVTKAPAAVPAADEPEKPKA